MRQGTGDSTVARQGNQVVMKNRLLEINFNLSKGTWSYFDQTGHIVIRNAYTKVVLQDGTVLTTLEAGIREFITHPITEDELGVYQPITFSHQGEDRDIRTHLYLNCYSNKPYIILTVGVENLNGKPLAVEQMTSIGVSPLDDKSQSGVYLGGDPSGYHILLSMNTPASQGVKRIYDGFTINKDTATSACYNGMLYDTDSKRSFVFGFLSFQKWWSTIQVGYNSQTQPNTGENQGIDLWSLDHKCENHLCAPGEVMKSEPAYLNFASEATESYRLYVEILAKRMDAQKLDHVFSGWSAYPADNRAPISAEQITQQVNQIAKNRSAYPSLPGGMEYILIEDGWQQVVGSHKVNPENFPDGMKPIVDQIHSKALKAGIRFAPFCVNGDSDLLKAHPEYFLQDGGNNPALVILPDPGTEVALLDVSHPEAQIHIRERLQEIIDEWGYDLVKVDLSAYAMGPMSDPSHFVWHNKSLTVIELYRLGIQLLNEIIEENPKDVILAAVDVCTGPSIGGFPVHHALPDDRGYIGSELWDDKAGAKQLISAYATHLPMHDIAWTGEFGALVIDEPSPLNEALVTITAAALSGGIVTWGDDLTKIKPARAELFAKLFPLTGRAATPVDFFGNKLPRIWNLQIRAPYDSWNVVGIFNWGDTVGESYFTLDSLGLDRFKDYLVHDFWESQFLGAVRGSVTLLNIPPRSVKLLGIRAEQRVPQLLATDIHFTQGCVEILSAGWDRRSQSFLAVCKPPRHSKGTLFVHGPEDYVPTATACYGSDYRFRWNKPIYELEFGPTSELVHVSVQFARTSG